MPTEKEEIKKALMDAYEKKVDNLLKAKRNCPVLS